MLIDAHLLLIFPVCSSEPLISLLIYKDESDILIRKQTHVYNYSFTFLFTKLDPVSQCLETTKPLPRPTVVEERSVRLQANKLMLREGAVAVHSAVRNRADEITNNFHVLS